MLRLAYSHKLSQMSKKRRGTSGPDARKECAQEPTPLPISWFAWSMMKVKLQKPKLILV